MSQVQEPRERALEVFAQVFDDLPSDIRPETSAADIPGWDSFNHINLVVALEEEFKIKFRSNEIQEMENFGQIMALINKKLNRG